MQETRPKGQLPRLGPSLQNIARTLEAHFLGKQEVIRLMLISAIAGEHMVVVGPPGTAKSAMIRMFARLIDAKYFEYLLTRFTEPNELFGPVDISAFRTGTYRRKTETMLPESEIVFLDEVFKSNSAILNSLLTLLNERIFMNGQQRIDVPLISVFGASNEVPNDETLMAIFDRFLLRVRSDNLDSYHFHDLLARGIRNEVMKITGAERSMRPVLPARELHALHASFDSCMVFPEEFLATYKGLVFQIRSEGISLSDRRVIKITKLLAASAFLDGRAACDAGDFFVLKHIWNNLDQSEILAEIVGPVLEAYFREHPEARRHAAAEVGLDALINEVNLIRDLIASGEPLSDIQLFSQLKSLNEIRAALQAIGTEQATQVGGMVDQLLEHVFQSSKFS
ncbi:MAG: AAA family ATPase [Deltaproteobacteria bacterium]|nr:AAA family ATPase [Deltaproteobacteria bacterium]